MSIDINKIDPEQLATTFTDIWRAEQGLTYLSLHAANVQHFAIWAGIDLTRATCAMLLKSVGLELMYASAEDDVDETSMGIMRTFARANIMGYMQFMQEGNFADFDLNAATTIEIDSSIALMNGDIPKGNQKASELLGILYGLEPALFLDVVTWFNTLDDIREYTLTENEYRADALIFFTHIRQILEDNLV